LFAGLSLQTRVFKKITAFIAAFFIARRLFPSDEHKAAMDKIAGELFG
tara:strand:+ start:782 stop:925 length:144 start_codon:yes stop_codon:yes gene_type:complete